MSKMIERVATVIHAAYGTPDSLDACRGIARCILASMHEPTNEMEQAGDNEQYDDYRRHSGWNTAKDVVENFDAALIWRTMIDAALKD